MYLQLLPLEIEQSSFSSATLLHSFFSCRDLSFASIVYHHSYYSSGFCSIEFSSFILPVLISDLLLLLNDCCASHVVASRFMIGTDSENWSNIYLGLELKVTHVTKLTCRNESRQKRTIETKDTPQKRIKGS